MTLGSGCLCSVPSPAWPPLGIAPRLHPAAPLPSEGTWLAPGLTFPALGPVGSWGPGPGQAPFNLSFPVWEAAGDRALCIHMQEGELRPRTLQKDHQLSELCSLVEMETARRGPLPASILLPRQWHGWCLPYSSLPQTRSTCPGFQWDSRHPAWSLLSSPDTVACGLSAAAGCWEQHVG